MPNPQNCTGRDFSMYDAMDDEQLRQILRDDASNTEGEDTDMELILHIMEVLAKRRREANQDISPEEALEEFKNKYSYTNNSLISQERPKKKKTIGFNRWQRWVATVAALLVLVFGSSLTAQALGFDLFEIIAKWTKETFHLGSINISSETNAPNVKDNLPYQKLQEALNRYNVEIDLIPSWIPSGYEEINVDVQETPKRRIFTAIYMKGDKPLQIRLSDHVNTNPVQVEQSDSLVELYTVDGIDYFIIANNDQMQIVWINGRFECVISGYLSLNEAKEIIDSI